MVTISWATKFIIVLREETATKQSETLNNGSKKLEEGINDTANIKGGTDGQTSRRLKRTETVVFF